MHILKKINPTRFDRLFICEKQFSEFKSMPDKFKLDAYSTHLKPAVSRLHSFVITLDSYYDKLDLLSRDNLYLDIDLLPYYIDDNTLSFELLKNANQLLYPKDEYKVINMKIGQYLQDDQTKTSIRIAVDYFLTSIATRWCNEIPFIRKELKEEE